MSTAQKSKPVLASTPWVPPLSMMWSKGRTYTLEEACKALFDCFGYLLGEDKLKTLIVENGCENLLDYENNAPTLEMIQHACGVLRSNAEEIFGDSIPQRSVYRLRQILKHCEDRNAAEESPPLRERTT